MKKGRLIAIGAVALVCAGQPAMAQYFTNDLTDAASADVDFNEKIASFNNSVWSYTNDYALAQDGTTNTVLQGGAVLDFVTTDDDTARSYLATVFSNYTERSWTAHIAVETVNVDPKNYIFFGLGSGVPNESYYQEPSSQSVFLSWQSGNSNSKVGVKRNGANVYNSGSWQGDPGYDIWMHYSHVNKTVYFELDNWNGGRFSGINITSDIISTDGYLNDTNNMSIFFGGNAKMTFGDFYVYEVSSDVPPPPPASVYSAYAPMEVTINWDEFSGADSFDVKRSTESGTGYTTIASGITTNTYVDTALTTNETYYYVVSATNAFGASDDSAEVQSVAIPYETIGPISTYGDPSLENDNLFDGAIATFFDTGENNSWAGLDFGENNELQVLQINYTLRDWRYSIARTTNATFQGASTPDFSDAVTLYTVPTDVSGYPAVNMVTITNTTAFRYVRMLSQPGRPLYGVAEIKFFTPEDYTSNGTPKSWLDDYDLVTGGDYEAADLGDTDTDRLLAWEEYVAGTIPTDGNSVLIVNSIEQVDTGLVISWQSVADKDYSIVTNASLTTPVPGIAVSNLVGLATETSYTTTVSGASAVFYEIGVE